MSFTIFDKFFGDLESEGIESEQQIYQSICSYLKRLLNSRLGSLTHLPDYGIPDLNKIYQDLPYSVNYLIQALKQTIEKYEQRLRNVRILQKPAYSDQYILHLAIQGEIITGEKLQFNTFFTSDCKTKIEI